MPRKAQDTAPTDEVGTEAAAAPAAAPEPRAEKPKKIKQFKITFHGDGAPVEIGHNFRMNVYPRNIETTIDENYLDVLRHSITATRRQDEAGNWQNVSIPTYQYTLGEQI